MKVLMGKMGAGIGLLLPWENMMGFRSLGLGFGHWEWEKKKKCQDIIYILGSRNARILPKHLVPFRQRNVRQDNTMDRAGTLPLNLYETETVWKPVNLNSLKGVERIPNESNEPANSNKDASLPPESPNNELVDSLSSSDSDPEEEVVDSALETTLSMIRPTRLGRIRTLTSRMTDFLQAGMAGIWGDRNLCIVAITSYLHVLVQLKWISSSLEVKAKSTCEPSGCETLWE